MHDPEYSSTLPLKMPITIKAYNAQRYKIKNICFKF